MLGGSRTRLLPLSELERSAGWRSGGQLGGGNLVGAVVGRKRPKVGQPSQGFFRASTVAKHSPAETSEGAFYLRYIPCGGGIPSSFGLIVYLYAQRNLYLRLKRQIFE